MLRYPRSKYPYTSQRKRRQAYKIRTAREKRRAKVQHAAITGTLVPIDLHGRKYQNSTILRTNYLDDIQLQFLPTKVGQTDLNGLNPFLPIAYAKTIISPSKSAQFLSNRIEFYDRVRILSIEITYIPTVTETNLNVFQFSQQQERKPNYPNDPYTNLPLVFVYDPTTDVLNGTDCVYNNTYEKRISSTQTVSDINRIGDYAMRALTKNQSYTGSLTKQTSQKVQDVVTYLHNESGISGPPTINALNTNMIYINKSTGNIDEDLNFDGRLYPTCGQLEVVVPYSEMFNRPVGTIDNNTITTIPTLILRFMFTFVIQVFGTN